MGYIGIYWGILSGKQTCLLEKDPGLVWCSPAMMALRFAPVMSVSFFPDDISRMPFRHQMKNWPILILFKNRWLMIDIDWPILVKNRCLMQNDTFRAPFGQWPDRDLHEGLGCHQHRQASQMEVLEQIAEHPWAVNLSRFGKRLSSIVFTCYWSQHLTIYSKL